MTFSAIKTAIKNRLGLTSTEADTRVGDLLNEHYREITASIGLNVSRRAKVPAATVASSNEVTFVNIENIEAVKKESVTPHLILVRVPWEEIQERHPETSTSNTPGSYAVKSITATGITIVLDRNAKSAYTLWAHGMSTVSDLTGNMEPLFPQSYHFILKERVLMDEYMRMEKKDLAAITFQRAEKGLSDLRMFIAKNGFLEINQGGSVAAEYTSSPSTSSRNSFTTKV